MNKLVNYYVEYRSDKLNFLMTIISSRKDVCHYGKLFIGIKHGMRINHNFHDSHP